MGDHTDHTLPACTIPDVHLMRSSDGFTVWVGRVPSDFLTVCAACACAVRQWSVGTYVPLSQVAKGENRFGASSRCAKYLRVNGKWKDFYLPWQAFSNNYICLFLSKFLFLNVQTVKMPDPESWTADQPQAEVGKSSSPSKDRKGQKLICAYLRSIKSKMLGQNQEWKQNSSCSLFHCISFLHVVHVVMGSVPTLAKTVGKKNLRIPRRSNPPKHPRTALAPQDGVQPQRNPNGHPVPNCTICDCGYVFNPCRIM